MAETQSVQRFMPVNVDVFVQRHAHWLLRGGFASIFLFHAIDKLPDPAGFATSMNLPAGVGIWVALAELGAGSLILAGGLPFPYRDLATRIGGLFGAIVMTGAIVGIHWGQWRFEPSDAHPMGGLEFQLLLGLVGVYFLLRGNGAATSEA